MLRREQRCGALAPFEVLRGSAIFEHIRMPLRRAGDEVETVQDARAAECEDPAGGDVDRGCGTWAIAAQQLGEERFVRVRPQQLSIPDVVAGHAFEVVTLLLRDRTMSRDGEAGPTGPHGDAPDLTRWFRGQRHGRQDAIAFLAKEAWHVLQARGQCDDLRCGCSLLLFELWDDWHVFGLPAKGELRPRGAISGAFVSNGKAEEERDDDHHEHQSSETRQTVAAGLPRPPQPVHHEPHKAQQHHREGAHDIVREPEPGKKSTDKQRRDEMKAHA